MLIEIRNYNTYVEDSFNNILTIIVTTCFQQSGQQCPELAYTWIDTWARKFITMWGYWGRICIKQCPLVLQAAYCNISKPILITSQLIHKLEKYQEPVTGQSTPLTWSIESLLAHPHLDEDRGLILYLLINIIIIECGTYFDLYHIICSVIKEKVKELKQLIVHYYSRV